MEYNRYLRCLPPDSISRFTAASIRSLGDERSELMSVIDRLGLASAKAQGYQVITSCAKLAQPQSQQQRLYIITDAPDEEEDDRKGVVRAVGFIKLGPVSLFIYNEQGGVHRFEPLCVLDFYVHESRQRAGLGRRLFEHMLAVERAAPQRLGYDRPSAKFLAFLHKHYGLVKYTPQVNGFVVFKQYFAPEGLTRFGSTVDFDSPSYASVCTSTSSSSSRAGRTSTAAPAPTSTTARHRGLADSYPSPASSSSSSYSSASAVSGSASASSSPRLPALRVSVHDQYPSAQQPGQQQPLSPHLAAFQALRGRVQAPAAHSSASASYVPSHGASSSFRAADAQSLLSGRSTAASTSSAAVSSSATYTFNSSSSSASASSTSAFPQSAYKASFDASQGFQSQPFQYRPAHRHQPPSSSSSRTGTSVASDPSPSSWRDPPTDDGSGNSGSRRRAPTQSEPNPASSSVQFTRSSVVGGVNGAHVHTAPLPRVFAQFGPNAPSSSASSSASAALMNPIPDTFLQSCPGQARGSHNHNGGSTSHQGGGAVHVTHRGQPAAAYAGSTRLW